MFPNTLWRQITLSHWKSTLLIYACCWLLSNPIKPSNSYFPLNFVTVYYIGSSSMYKYYMIQLVTDLYKIYINILANKYWEKFLLLNLQVSIYKLFQKLLFGSWHHGCKIHFITWSSLLPNWLILHCKNHDSNSVVLLNNFMVWCQSAVHTAAYRYHSPITGISLRNPEREALNVPIKLTTWKPPFSFVAGQCVTF